MCPRVLDVSRAHLITLSLAIVVVLAVLVEVLAFFAWLTNPFAALKQYSGVTGYLFAAARIELTIFYLAYALVVWLVLFLMVSPIAERAFWLAKRRRSSVSPVNVRSVQLKSVALGIGLAAASVLAALVAYLPYTYSQYPVGIDAHSYYETLNALGQSASLSQLLAGEPRAVYLLLLYAIRSAAQLPVRDTVMLGSIMISILFVLGSFLLVRWTGQGDLASLVAGLFAGVSSQTLVGTLASIFPNWLAMAEILFFFAFLLRAARTGSKAALIISFAISLAVMVTHPWTWAILVLILAVYVVISALQDRSWDFVRRSAGLRILVAGLLTGLVIFVVASGLPVFQGIVSLGYSWGLIENLRLSRTPLMFLRDMQIALMNYSTQGFYSNWLLLSLSIVGVFRLAKTQKETRALFVSWVLTPSLLILLLSPEIQWRLLFLMPYNILAVLGVLTLLDALTKLGMVQSGSRTNSLIARVIRPGLVTFLLLLFLNNALRSMVVISTLVVL